MVSGVYNPGMFPHHLEYGDGLLAEPDGIEDVVMENRLKQIVLTVGLKGRLSGHHLVQQYSQGPPVH